MTNFPNPDENHASARAGWEHIFRGGDIPPRYRSLAEPNPQVVEWADTLPAGGLLLDVGCGVGRHVVYLGGRGFRIAGIDISPTGIRMSQEISAQRQIPFEGHVSPMTALPWPAITFDGALSTSAIHHQRRADLVQALAEVWRVLKPGAVFIADFPSTDTLDYQDMRTRVAAGQLTEVEPNTFVDESTSPDPMEDLFLPHHYCDAADLRDLLRHFEIVRLQADLRPVTTAQGSGKVGKWVVWARRPMTT
ncbi:MAG: class I SAM-dependent methyltransferase [Chloroflexi bacterium]|nr:class I SAM-dependent methyltransferase [Chloroflexota bacterium]